MSIHISVDRMTCDASAHAAWRVSAPAAPERWRVTWLPERLLGRNQAITAMTLAEAFAPGTHHRPAPAAIAAWAGELGMTPADVAAYLTGWRTR